MPAILATKLYAPPQRREVVLRRALMARLEDGAAPQTLCLLSAPAGFGKTTTVVQWLSYRDRTCAWLSLDEADNDAERFWRHVLGALRTVWPDAGAGADALLPSGTAAFVEALINDVARRENRSPQPVVLVLDDYHLIRQGGIHRGVDYLLDHLPPQLAVVIATREDPPLSLPRRRARGMLTEVRAADLRFAPDEAAVFLNDGMGLSLTEADVEALERRTEGWIASLHLAALSLQRHDDPAAFIHSFAGSDRYVVDYLVEEVLAFLLATAVLDRFCASLCDALLAAWGETPPAHELLDQLERANLFLVPLDRERRWFRYHALFADLLRLRLRRDYPDRIAALHERASRWFEARGLIDDAIGHALDADNLARAADLIEHEGMTLIARLGRPVPVRWLDALPDAHVRERPMLAVVHAWSHLLRQPMLLADRAALATVEERLKEAERALAAGDHDAVADEVRGHVRMCRAHLARYRGDVEEGIRLSSEVLEWMPRELGIVRSGTAFNLGLLYLAAGDAEAAVATFREAERWTTAENHFVRVGLRYMRALVLIRSGRLSEGYALCDETLESLRPPDASDVFPSYAGSHFVGRGRVLFEWNRLAEAEQQLRTGLRHVRRSGDPLIEANGRAVLARVLHAQGDAAGADAELETVAASLPAAAPLVRAVRMNLGLDRGGPEAGEDVVAWAAEGEQSFGAVVALGEWPFALWLARGRRLVLRHAAGDVLAPREAEQVKAALTAHAERVEQGGWGDKALEVLALLAVAHEVTGAPDAADIAVARALRLAQPEGYVRRFVAEGVPMARLLYRHVQHADAPDDLLADHAMRVLAAFPKADAAQPAAPAKATQPPARPVPDEFVEPLSPRETEVLQLIAQGMTNQEVADELFISYETVKVHARNIYGKLDVRGRVEAVARAQSLGLLPVA